MRQIEARRDHLVFGMFVKSTKGLEPSDLSQDLPTVGENEKTGKNTVIRDGQQKKKDKKDKKRRKKHKRDESSDDEKVAKKNERTKKIKSEKNKNKKSRRHLTDDDMLREIGQPRKKLGKLARAAEQEAAFLRSLQAESH
jgi:hypothetical protein